jgi:peroxiredoxin
MTNPHSVAAAPELVCPLLNGMKIPEVSVRAADGSIFELTKSVRERPAILVFYRGGW